MGSAYQRSISDLEENVLSFAEVKALALSDPRMKTLAEKENQLINLRIVNRKAVESRSQMEKDIESTKQVVEMINKQIEGSKLNHFDLKNRKENDYKLLRKTLTVILEPRHIHSGNKNLGEAWGFNFNVPEQQEHNTFVFTISRNGVIYSLESGNSASGNAQRVTNFFKGLDTYILELEEKVKTNEYKLTKLKEEIARNNPYCKQIKKLEKEIRHLRAKIEESS